MGSDSLARRMTAVQEDLASSGSHYFPVLGSSSVRQVLVRRRDSVAGDYRLYLNCASSNYLNLSIRPEVIEAGKKALEHYGSGANGAPILSGQYEIHEALAEAIARFHGAPAAALFPSGYAANLGCITAACTAADCVALDARVHASIVDGARLSRARVCTFAHNSIPALRELLERLQPEGASVLVATETVFSMDADVCPLEELVQLRHEYGFRMLLDDAHAVGVLGVCGRGGMERFGIPEESLDFHGGTFSKTFAGIGGYVTGRRDVVEYLSFVARSSLFSANMPPAIAACCLAAVGIVEREGAVLAARLRSRAVHFRAELARHGIAALGYPESPIVPVIIPGEDRIEAVARSMRAKGVLVNLARFPAVPAGQSRLRFVLNLGLTEEDLAHIAALLKQSWEGVPAE